MKRGVGECVDGVDAVPVEELCGAVGGRAAGVGFLDEGWEDMFKFLVSMWD
jgi:hypothetical protein